MTDRIGDAVQIMIAPMAPNWAGKTDRYTTARIKSICAMVQDEAFARANGAPEGLAGITATLFEHACLLITPDTWSSAMQAAIEARYEPLVMALAAANTIGYPTKRSRSLLQTPVVKAVKKTRDTTPIIRILHEAGWRSTDPGAIAGALYEDCDEAILRICVDQGAELVTPHHVILARSWDDPTPIRRWIEEKSDGRLLSLWRLLESMARTAGEDRQRSLEPLICAVALLALRRNVKAVTYAVAVFEGHDPRTAHGRAQILRIARERARHDILPDATDHGATA